MSSDDSVSHLAHANLTQRNANVKTIESIHAAALSKRNDATEKPLTICLVLFTDCLHSQMFVCDELETSPDNPGPQFQNAHAGF